MSKQNLLGKESLAEKMEKIKKEIGNIQPGSPNDDQPKTKQQKAPHTPKPMPKLFVSGRLDRKKHSYTAKSLMLLTKLDDEIKTHCRGGDLVILNYLIKEGLKKVRDSDSPISVDIEEIESDIT